ncbi:putative histidine-containing phosphotransfer protein 2 [Hibiscus syriacus]|uniref:Histidine-containing phosphotransfer protein 2 n=1 Tax=Hibiscus syriacus TaxID=106335 RepID=A0A6A3CF60_HIBSY|nr:putative histidine-containing phosphotransfer protein 2 [Hibiscus syriacus]
MLNIGESVSTVKMRVEEYDEDQLFLDGNSSFERGDGETHRESIGLPNITGTDDVGENFEENTLKVALAEINSQQEQEIAGDSISSSEENNNHVSLETVPTEELHEVPVLVVECSVVMRADIGPILELVETRVGKETQTISNESNLIEVPIEEMLLFNSKLSFAHRLSGRNINRRRQNAEADKILGHAVNHIYDLLYLMNRNDVAVGVGGEGGILEDGTILPNAGGYLPIIEQGMTGYCRYRQAITVCHVGRLWPSKTFLPQGSRRYSPLQQPTAQQVMIETLSTGLVTVFLIGAHTNLTVRKSERLLFWDGSSSRQPGMCDYPGNLFTDFDSNPYAEFNIFGDPFAAYQVFHSGIPITIVPLDATNTIPITKEFLKAFEESRGTYEAEYCFRLLKTKLAPHSADKSGTYVSFVWDSFMAGVAVSIMRNSDMINGENEFAEMEYMNVTVVTSNKPYGISDGSNPFFDHLEVPKFRLKKDGVHSGHVQTELRDSFCFVENGKGKCKDGYTMEATSPVALRILVAIKTKPNLDVDSKFDRQFFISFLAVINSLEQTGRFNLSTEFPYYREVLYKPDFGNKKLGKPVVFDMDMSAGDFLYFISSKCLWKFSTSRTAANSLIRCANDYLNLMSIISLFIQAILVTPTGWASAASIDIIYDLLHMMGRDDIPVGLGDVFAMNQSAKVFPRVGDCTYAKAIPHGSRGFLDTDTVYGLARDLLKQPSALEIWTSILKTRTSGPKINILTNGPLSTLANIITQTKTASLVQNVYIVGGHISRSCDSKGNVFTTSNKYAEFNMFLNLFAAKTVFEPGLNITLILLGTQRKVVLFTEMLKRLKLPRKTSKARFRQASIVRTLQFAADSSPISSYEDLHKLKPTIEEMPIKVIAEGVESVDGQILIDEEQGATVKILKNVETAAYYDLFAGKLGAQNQSTVLGSYDEQRIM